MHGIKGMHIHDFGGKPGGNRPLGRPNVDGRILLKWILEK
jgi:hypothetical protein